MPSLLWDGRQAGQPSGRVPRLRGDFADPTFIFLPSANLLVAFPYFPGTVSSGTVTLGNGIQGNLPSAPAVAQFSSNQIVFGQRSRDLAFPNGMTIGFAGSYTTASGICSVLSRGSGGSSPGGIELDMRNQFGGTPGAMYGGHNVSGSDTPWNSAWFGTSGQPASKDAGQGNGVGSVFYTTAVNTRYTGAVASTPAQATGASTSDDLGMGGFPGFSGTSWVEFVVIWGRVLGEAQLQQLASDPYSIFLPQQRIFLAEPAAGGVSAALTGVAGTGSVGTVGVSVSKALTGNAGTGAAGTVTPNTSVGITGNAGTGSVGTVAPVIAPALTGNAGTGAVGTVGPNVTVALTGVSATGAVGSVTAVTGYSAALTGVQATGAVGTVSPVVSKALTGNAATGAVGTVAPSTSAALTGNAGTGATGTVSPALSKALTGNAGTGAVGTVGPATSKVLTGNAGTGAAGTVGPNVTVALTGVSGTGQVGNVSVSVPGQSALSGVAATGSAGTVGAAVTIALSGVSATSAVGSLGKAVAITLTGASASANAGTLIATGTPPDVLGGWTSNRTRLQSGGRSNVQTRVR